MQVEVYDEREIEPTTLKREDDAEAVALIEELGLTRQLHDSGNRICYPAPNVEQAFAMEMLFPAATYVQDYDAGGLPLRVLKEIRSYRAENPDHLLVVRHAAPAILKDPVLLAYTGKPANSIDYYAKAQVPEWPKFRMIARWGDALASWADLATEAAKIATAQMNEELLDIIAQCEARRAAIAKGWLARSRQPLHFHLR